MTKVISYDAHRATTQRYSARAVPSSFDYRDGDSVELHLAKLVDDLRVLAADATEIADRLAALDHPGRARPAVRG